MPRQIVILLSVVVAWALVPFAAAAQDSGGERINWEFVITAKDGHQAELEAAMKAHSKWRNDNGDPWNWEVYQSVTGKPMYVIRSFNHSWADLDSYFTSEFGQKAGAEFNKNVAPHMKVGQSAIYRDDPEISNWKDNENYRFFEVTELQVSDTRAFRDAVKTTIETLKANNWPRSAGWEWLVAGGKPNTVALVIASTNWAGLQAPSPGIDEVMVKAHGQEKADAVRNQFLDATEFKSTNIFMHRPDLRVAGQTN